jgi:hypothetical protein
MALRSMSSGAVLGKACQKIPDKTFSYGIIDRKVLGTQYSKTWPRS